MPFEVSGIAGLIEYNGLVFNDRRFFDSITITNISGLDDADLRDSREVNPDRDGETAFNSYYAGRQLGLRGYITAGNFFSMQTLWGQLKAAFDEPVDGPLNFLWQDAVEDWQGNWSQDYAFDSGSAATLSSPGAQYLVTTDTSAKRFYYVQRSYVDAEVTINYTNGPGGTNSGKIAAVMKRIDPNNYLLFSYQSGTLRIESVSGGTATTILSVTYSANVSNKSYWLHGIIDGNTAQIELWDIEPYDDGTPLAMGTVGVSSAYGAGASGNNGILFAPSSTSDMTINRVRFDGRNPGDTMIYGRKNAKIESEDVIDDKGRYRKNFLIPFRSASPNFVSRKRKTFASTISSSTLIFPADGSGLTFPSDGSGIIFGVPVATNPVNLGRSPASPIVRIYGPCVNPAIYDSNTNTRLVSNATLTTTSQYIQFDVGKEEVTDQNGADAYNLSDPATNWMKLGRGANILIFGADSISAGVTQITIVYRHTSR